MADLFNWNQGMLDFTRGSGNNSYMANTGMAPGSAVLNQGTNPLMQGVGGWNIFSNVLGGIQGIANAYTGFKQLGLAKDQFNWQKDAFNTNLVNQSNLVNSQLADRQRRRQFFDPNAASPEAYLAQYGAASSVGEAKDRQKANQNTWTNSQAMNRVTTGG